MYSLFKHQFFVVIIATMSVASGIHAQHQNDEFLVRHPLPPVQPESQQGVILAMNDFHQNWWEQYVTQPMLLDAQPLQTDLHSLFFLALQYSAQIKVYSETPIIRETAILEAQAAFDWTTYFDGLWEDLDEPVGSSLTVGGTGDRFKDHNLGLTGGLRRKLLSGSEIDISQRIGHQNTNSNFFIPNDQGSARLSLGINIPLLRGRGVAYNKSLQCLAAMDVETANDEFRRQLQSHLLEITRAYWSLYLERASSVQKHRLAEATEEVFQRLQHRQALDASPTQLKTVQAALANRRSELIRATAAIRNAETRLRALVHAPELGVGDGVELVPMQLPVMEPYQTDTQSQLATAMQNRPEIHAATREIKAACIRLNMSKHEMLPIFNLITRTYLSGLQGESDVGQAWTEQFTVGAPSYSVGLRYEVPLGNRAAGARMQRRYLEKRQLENQYRSAIENIKAEVEVAVRELFTAQREMVAKRESVNAAATEVSALDNRWSKMIDEDGAASLTLESLLRSQERLAAAEFELAQAQLTYNLALANLNLVNGTLLETEQVSIGRACTEDGPMTILSLPDH